MFDIPSLKPCVGKKTSVWPNDLHYRTVSTGLVSIHTVKTILLSLTGAGNTKLTEATRFYALQHIGTESNPSAPEYWSVQVTNLS